MKQNAASIPLITDLYRDLKLVGISEGTTDLRHECRILPGQSGQIKNFYSHEKQLVCLSSIFQRDADCKRKLMEMLDF
jgi:hypothetical protein